MRTSNLGKVVIIIQARMGSLRFPGKMMEQLGNYPLIEWVIRRSSQARIHATVLATTDKPIDDKLVSEASKLQCSVFRGSESDVLGRYFDAACYFKADTIIRVCGDRPLISPTLIDRAIDLYSLNIADIVYNHISGQGQLWPRGFGVEVFSFNMLKKLNDNVHDRYEREHVTLHAWNCSDNYRILADKCYGAYMGFEKDLKLDVDTAQDLDRIRSFVDGCEILCPSEEILSTYRNNY